MASGFPTGELKVGKNSDIWCMSRKECQASIPAPSYSLVSLLCMLPADSQGFLAEEE